MERRIFRLKNDPSRKRRGGYARFLNIYCSNCKSHLLFYQKDGPGPLKRLYIDRIVAPEKLVAYQNHTIQSIPSLICSHCSSVIGTPILYEKEKRKAFLLNPSLFAKKVSKGIYPPEVRDLP